MKTMEGVESMKYTQILDTLSRCRRLAARFRELRDQVDGLLLTGPNAIAHYGPSTGATSHGTSDPVYDHIQKLEALQGRLEAVWSDYKSADYKARVLIKSLCLTERERDVLDIYYRELSSQEMIDGYFADQTPPIRDAADLDRARQSILRKLRRRQRMTKPPKGGEKSPRHR